MTWYPNKIEVFRIEPENLVPRLWFVVTYTPNRRSTTPSAFTIAYSLYVSMEKRRNLPLVRKIEPSSSGPTAVGFDLRPQDAITRKLALHSRRCSVKQWLFPGICCVSALYKQPKHIAEFDISTSFESYHKEGYFRGVTFTCFFVVESQVNAVSESKMIIAQVMLERKARGLIRSSVCNSPTCRSLPLSREGRW